MSTTPTPSISNAIRTAQRLDWNGWLVGIMGAIISGAAGAISNFGTAGYMEIKYPQTGAGLKTLLVATGIGCIVSAIVSLAKFLTAHDVPGYVESETGGSVAP